MIQELLDLATGKVYRRTLPGGELETPRRVGGDRAHSGRRDRCHQRGRCRRSPRVPSERSVSFRWTYADIRQVLGTQRQGRGRAVSRELGRRIQLKEQT